MTTQSQTTPQHQLAMVFDLNKCTGCQTCSVACKVLWTRDEGAEYQWWCIVNTQPGKGTPKDWEQMGGGYRDGELVLGHLPTREVENRQASPGRSSQLEGYGHPRVEGIGPGRKQANRQVRM